MNEKIMCNMCMCDVCSTSTHMYCYQQSILDLHLSLCYMAVLNIEISNYYRTPTLYRPNIPISQEGLEESPL